MDDAPGPVGVSCEEVLDFKGAELPPDAEPVGDCTSQGAMDFLYRAEFQMPRDDVQDWLARTYPDAPAPGKENCDGDNGDADLCLYLTHSEKHLPKDVKAHGVDIAVVHVDDGTALVRYASYTT